MTRSQIDARIRKAATLRRQALKTLGKALAVLDPAATVAREIADASTGDGWLDMERAERRGRQAEAVETLLGDLGIVYEELQGVDPDLALQTR